MPDKGNEPLLRECLGWTNALLRAMDVALRGEDPANVWKHGGYKVFARKYNQLLAEIRKATTLPALIDAFDLDKIPGGMDSLGHQQKEIFEAVYVNASLLRSFLENRLGVVEDETVGLRDFLQARMRSAMFSIPKDEREVQDAVERLFIGRGLQKGDDYDREVGRVKVSTKEFIPDFVLLNLDLGLR